MKKSKEEKLVEEMNSLLDEVSDLNCEEINDSNYIKFYENAANQLEYFEEDEEGEGDIYRFTYNILDEYVDLRNELKEVLEAKGMTLEQRKLFYKENLC